MSVSISPDLRRRIIDAALAAERDYSEGLSVAMMAEHTGISEKHFQRCFREILGESPKSYIRRIRMQYAAYLLKWSDAPITDIAARTGFNTHAGFTKAFQKSYSISPLQFRQSRKVSPYLFCKEDASRELDFDDFEALKLTVRIEQMPSWRVATMRHVGPVEKTADIWPKMIKWAKQRDLFHADTIFLGIHNDYWDSNAEGRYRYDAAVVVPDEFEIDNNINTYTINAGPVAMTEFKGSISEVDDAWRRFVDQWLPISGFKLRTSYAFDRYPYKTLAGGMIQNIMTTLMGIQATLCLPVTK